MSAVEVLVQVFLWGAVLIAASLVVAVVAMIFLGFLDAVRRPRRGRG